MALRSTIITGVAVELKRRQRIGLFWIIPSADGMVAVAPFSGPAGWRR
jgi:hypothetical protein